MSNTQFNLNQFSEARKCYDLLVSEGIPREKAIEIIDSIELTEAKLLITMLIDYLNN